MRVTDAIEIRMSALNLLDMHYRTFGSVTLRRDETFEPPSLLDSEYLRSMLFAQVVGHESLGAKLREAVRNNRVAHAQLFAGHEGSGALALARAYAQYLTCESPTEQDSCGTCKSWPCACQTTTSRPALSFPYFKGDGQEKATSDPY